MPKSKALITNLIWPMSGKMGQLNKSTFNNALIGLTDY